MAAGVRPPVDWPVGPSGERWGVSEREAGTKLLIGRDYGLFVGPLPELAAHTLAVDVLVAGLREPFLVSGERVVPYRCALIRAGTRHALHAGGAPTAVIFWEPDAPHPWRGLPLAAVYEVAPDCRCAVLDAVARVRGTPVDARQAEEALAAAMASCREPAADGRVVDPRIARVIARIREHEATEASSEALAAEIELSPQRLQHLFSEQTGAPLSRFRIWTRLRKAAVALARGGRLTDAALDSGFTDSAHFSRAFYDMFGLRPSRVFGRLERTEIIVG